MPRLATIRAKAGAMLLDIVRPGWAQEIDLGSLDLGDCDVCVLGQLYGDYEEGAAKLFAVAGNPEEASKRAGFNVPEWYGGRRPFTYSVLTDAWKIEIRNRQRKERRAQAAA